ncbi:MAG TPA: polysaccharide biosynthesis/export family protein [Smithella sp.]|jgi:polysaccharide export outer membrane protein|nr:polysaccharide biosynthesis/export family protein [Smithella sp.]HOG91654.1 polysaccharide biosynthesis/export family protein [Smithella sp.]
MSNFVLGNYINSLKKLKYYSPRLLKSLWNFTLLCGLLCIFTACGAMTGEVVKITEVENPLAGLKKEDQVKAWEIKKTLGAKDDTGLKDILEKTQSFTVVEYLAKYAGPSGKSELSDYRVGGYDVLSITVYDEQDLSKDSIRVSSDGLISFPLVGRLQVGGLTTSEIEQLISKELARGEYLNNAHVSVMVTQYASSKFSVLGAVKSPGTYPIQAKELILDGLSKAGGVDSATGEMQEAMIIRTIKSDEQGERKIVINFDLQGLLKGKDQISNIPLMDKDVLYIPKENYFYIMGQVKNPGSYTFTKKDINIVEAVSMAGGFTPIASRNETRIVRNENGIEKIYEVRVDAITKGGKINQAVFVKPNDLIIVPESFF